jgi:hypothetical protein
MLWIVWMMGKIKGTPLRKKREMERDKVGREK